MGTGWQTFGGRLRTRGHEREGTVSVALSHVDNMCTKQTSARLTWESGLAVIDGVTTGGDEPGYAPARTIVSIVVVGVVVPVDDGGRLGVGVGSHRFDFVGHGGRRSNLVLVRRLIL